MKKMMLLLCVLLWFPTAQALADVAPPPDYVETCTVDKQQKDGLTCKECSTGRETSDKCKNEWGAKGYTKACKALGATVWKEIWCKSDGSSKEPAGDKDAAKPDNTSKDSGSAGDKPTDQKGWGCSVRKGGVNPLGMLALFFLISFGLIRHWKERE